MAYVGIFDPDLPVYTAPSGIGLERFLIPRHEFTLTRDSDGVLEPVPAVSDRRNNAPGISNGERACDMFDLDADHVVGAFGLGTDEEVALIEFDERNDDIERRE
ncbi:unnamed protein product [Mycena citricolor]|uniref:Uncharacterized protein n=1 Tax=Mycena citricolor TaxID=2018698 RepID=A0AAD2HMF6_9AGAR|nr:unnamed protein product [Mycena citricolor]